MSLHDPDALIACHDCDLLHHLRPLRDGSRARCQRCGALLYSSKRDSLRRSYHLVIAAAILLLLSNIFPFMSFAIAGRVQHNTLATGVIQLWGQGFVFLAFMVLLSSILAPALRIALLMLLIVPLRHGRRPPAQVHLSRFASAIRQWGMLDVFLLGVIVAIVKLSSLAEINLGIAFYAFIALILVLTSASAALDPRLLWSPPAERA